MAIAGLLGGLIAWVLLGHARLPRPPRAAAGLLLAGAVVLWALGDEHGVPILAGTLPGAALLHLATRQARKIPTAQALRHPTPRPT